MQIDLSEAAGWTITASTFAVAGALVLGFAISTGTCNETDGAKTHECADACGHRVQSWSKQAGCVCEHGEMPR